MIRKTRKPTLDLTLHDFDAHPIWMDYVDDDDMLVVPDEKVDLSEGIYYCKAEFYLSDSSPFLGYMRISDGELMAVGIWNLNQEFLVYPLVERIREPISLTPLSFAVLLGRSADQVFPLKYYSRIETIEIEGSIDLDTTDSISIYR